MSTHRDKWMDAVLEHAAIALYHFSTARGGLDYSSGVATLLGWDVETLRQNPWHWQQAIHPDDMALVKATVELLKAGELFTIEYRIRHADGRWRWLQDRAVSVELDGDELLIDGIATDITARKEAERERGMLLEELSGARIAQARAEVAIAEDRSRQLIRSIGEAVVGLDNQGRITFFNPAAETLFGHRETSVLGQSLHALIHHSRADGSPCPEQNCPLTRRLGQAFDHVLNTDTFWRRDGRFFTGEYSFLPLLSGGRVSGAVVLIRDVTERERTAQRLAEAANQAAAANQAKSQFLANVSHEIRTPMNAIIGLAELLLRTQLDERQRDYLEKAHRSALLLLGLLNDVLDFSKIESGHLRLDPHPFQFDHVLEQVADLYGDAAAEKGLEFIIDVAPDLPHEVIGDSLRLTQVISNLCSNAIKFTTQGDVLLQLEVQRQGAAQIDLHVAVRDTGIGMSREQAEHIFDAFAQADGSTTRRYGGTGLGLSICRNLVERMGGRLELETEPGQGSRFSFCVPLELPSPQVALPVPLAGTDVLVACKHPAQRHAVVRLLHGLGAQAVAAESPAAALAACRLRDAKTKPPLLVLADESNSADPELMDWLKGRAASAGGAPGLVLAWQQHIVQPPAWPEAPLIGRPVTRRPLLNAIFALQGKAESGVAANVMPQPDLSGARILLVDDYALNVEIVSAFLHDARCQVTVARDGLEALECLQREAFDAVLMDCQMPVMDGYEATRAIRQDVRWQQLPVIAMTANVMEGDREKCFAAGMNDFVPKPIMIEQLLTVLGHHLQREARLSSAVRPPAQAAGIDLGLLVNLDVAAALQSTMGQMDFLARILRIFLDTQCDFAAKFATAQADAFDPDAAGRAAHTLKGAAASIGAQALREAAQTLEQACKQHAAAASIQAAFGSVMQELLPVLTGVERALGMAPAPAPIPAA